MTTFQLPTSARGESFVPRWPDARTYYPIDIPIGIDVSPSFWRAMKARGVTWCGATLMDQSFQYRKELGPIEPLVKLMRQANYYGVSMIIRGNHWKQHIQEWRAGTRTFDPWILEVVKAFPQVSRVRNCFQMVHEWGLVGDRFTQTALADATSLVDAFYDRMLPQIRAICPDLTVCLSAPGWSKGWTKDHLLMKPRPKENIIRAFDVYGGTQADVQAIKAWGASRGEPVMMLEGHAQEVSWGLSAGLASAEWLDHSPG